MNETDFNKKLDDIIEFHKCHSEPCINAGIDGYTLKKLNDEIGNIKLKCTDFFNETRNAMLKLFGNRKLVNKDKKFSSLSLDEKLELINNFNIYQSNIKDVDDHLYLVLSNRLSMFITGYVFETYY